MRGPPALGGFAAHPLLGRQIADETSGVRNVVLLETERFCVPFRPSLRLGLSLCAQRSLADVSLSRCYFSEQSPASPVPLHTVKPCKDLQDVTGLDEHFFAEV